MKNVRANIRTQKVDRQSIDKFHTGNRLVEHSVCLIENSTDSVAKSYKTSGIKMYVINFTQSTYMKVYLLEIFLLLVERKTSRQGVDHKILIYVVKIFKKFI